MVHWLLALLMMDTALAAEIKPVQRLDRAELTARLQGDSRAVLSHRDGLRAVIRYVESTADLFPAESLKETRLLRREEKEVVCVSFSPSPWVELGSQACAGRHPSQFR